MNTEPLRFQPGWATPIITDLGNTSWLAWFLGALEKQSCAARRQGRCPGRDQCHDCNWSAGSSA